MPWTISLMKQGYISEIELQSMIQLITEIHFNTERVGNVGTLSLGPYDIVTRLFYPNYPSYTSGSGSQIFANYDPFNQDVSKFTDVPDIATQLWTQLKDVVENKTSLTNKHPDFSPSFSNIG
jgi:hypothetical protein